MVKAIDLFSGCGGVSCGLVNAGFTVTAAVEIEHDARVVYNNYPPLANTYVFEEDICNVSTNALLKKAKIRKDELFLLAGCPPCQNFSTQNKKNKSIPLEEKQKLLMQFLRVIKDCYPPFILMENVPGIQTANDGVILRNFLSALRNTDSNNNAEKYEIKDGVLNAADFGVPQARKRYVLHAVRKDILELLEQNNVAFSLPSPTHDRLEKNNLLPWVTVEETIMDLPQIKHGELYAGNSAILNHKCAAFSEINISRIQAIRASGGSRKGLPDELVLKCHKTYSGHSDVYGIMAANKPAPTITGGCLCYSKGRYGHPTQDRALSIREAARLQTFPDDFEFSNNVTKAGLQIGNAVPVKLVESSAKTLYDTIKQVEKILRTQKR